MYTPFDFRQVCSTKWRGIDVWGKIYYHKQSIDPLPTYRKAVYYYLEEALALVKEKFRDTFGIHLA